MTIQYSVPPTSNQQEASEVFLVLSTGFTALNRHVTGLITGLTDRDPMIATVVDGVRGTLESAVRVLRDRHNDPTNPTPASELFKRMIFALHALDTLRVTVTGLLHPHLTTPSPTSLTTTLSTSSGSTIIDILRGN